MAKLKKMSIETVEIESFFRNKLQTFPLYSQKHVVRVNTLADIILIGYAEQDGFPRTVLTHTDLQVERETCYVLSFAIAQKHTCKGNGRTLYYIIEELARYLGCKTIQTTPSGQGVFFWPRMGFRISNDLGAVKILE